VIRGERPLPAGIAGGGAVVTLVLSQTVSPGDQIALTLEQAVGAVQPTTGPVPAGRI